MKNIKWRFNNKAHGVTSKRGTLYRWNAPHLVDIEKRTYVKILNGGVFFMAKKGQKFMEYDNDFREKVVLDYLNSNLGYKKIAEKYFIESWKTVETWVRKYKSIGTTDNQKVWNIKKIPSLPQGRTREKVKFISTFKNKYDLKDLFDESKGTYGYRRIEEGLLQKWGLIMNHKKVYRIMKKYDLRPKYTKKIKNQAYKRIEENVKPNLVNRKFNTEAPNKIWTTDITYLILNGKRAYLSTILDLYDRKIVAYKISNKNDLNIVIETLNEAISKRKNVQGVILHSDQGFQYTSFQYKEICESNGIIISMSRKGTPIDDSPMESFHGILKKETLYNNDIRSLEQYIDIVKDWLLFYNTIRLKSNKKYETTN